MILRDLLIGKQRSSKRVPLWFMRQAGRTLPEYRALRAKTKSFWDMCFIPEFTVEASLQPIKRFDLDAAILFSDILTVPKALGQNIVFKEGVGPICDTNFIQNLPVFQEVLFQKTLAPIKTSLQEIRSALPKEKTLIGFVGGPFTVSCYMVEGKKSKDHNTIKSFLYKNPEKMEHLLSLLIEASVVYAKEQRKAGADVIQIFDSWGGVLPPRYFKKYVLKPVLDLVQAIRGEYPNIPVIVFPRGASAQYKLYVESNLFDGLSLDHQVDQTDLLSQFSQKICFQGGIDPACLLAGGDVLKETIRETLQSFSGERYICNLSHGLDPRTPVENIEAFVNCVRQCEGS